MKKIITISILTLSSFVFTLCNGQIINTIAGNHAFGAGYSGDGGAATDAELRAPALLAFDTIGNLYFIEYLNNVVRKVDTAGMISTVAGQYPGGFYGGDGGQATDASLFGPIGIAFDKSGNLYIAEYNNCVIRKVNSSGIISTVAGNNGYGHNFSGDGGPATTAELGFPYGVAFDASGNMYIGDSHNYVVRMVNTSGIISTFAGNNAFGAGYSGDGGAATAAELNIPYGVSFDAGGTLYIADENNNVIRKVNTSGTISTFVGNHVQGYSGDGGQATNAELYNPTYAVFDNFGNFYIADWQNNLIRRVDSSGIITTIAGNHSYGSGYSGDGGPATNAEIYQPTGIALNTSGKLFFSDSPNDVIREITGLVTVGSRKISNINSLFIYPNPANDEITLQMEGDKKMELVELFDMSGQKLFERKLTTPRAVLNTGFLQNGIYFLVVQMQDGSKLEKKVEILR